MKLLSSTKISALSQYRIETDNSNFLIFDSSNSESIIAHNSMIAPIYTREGTVLGTRAGITDISMMAEVYARESGINYSDFIYECLSLHYATPIFEFCSRKNRVVIDYTEDKLVLTGIRFIETGEYVDYDMIKAIAADYGVPVVMKTNSIINEAFKDFQQSVSDLVNDEGIVIRFESGSMCGHMVKMKSSQYVLQHRAVDSLKFAKDAIMLYLTGALDDILPVLSVDRREHVEEFIEDFAHQLLVVTSTKIEKTYEEVSHLKTQKEFAFVVVGSPYQQFLFGLRKGNQLKSMLIEWAKKQCSTQPQCASMLDFIGVTVSY